jgi:hypothetical protein
MKTHNIPGGDNQFWAAMFAALAIGILVGVFATIMLKHHF